MQSLALISRVCMRRPTVTAIAAVPAAAAHPVFLRQYATRTVKPRAQLLRRSDNMRQMGRNRYLKRHGLGKWAHRVPVAERLEERHPLTPPPISKCFSLHHHSVCPGTEEIVAPRQQAEMQWRDIMRQRKADLDRQLRGLEKELSGKRSDA
eukprot:NODE_5478_length_673_cov_11.855769_g5103_i0.p1 GENE.NODE_5478_length_673_cov_11.855769_g5103_i0~~NODE_5478_length_673_cov_11.855769_g5103_i0.p1  ORF type:complete len:151 (+),score=19.05 NODE_5478_length_673_cov_11.855769_g5103_i0:122-574(+)